MQDNNKTLVYVLCGVVAALLIALVGVLAYNYGKNNSSDVEDEMTASMSMSTDNISSTIDTVVEATSEPMTSPAIVPDIPVEPAEPQEDVRERPSWHLTGTIAGKGVVVDLDSYDDGTVSGSYYYTKFGPSSVLELDGYMESNGRIYLTEYNSDRDIESGYLEGRMTSTGALTGKFTNIKGNTYKVNLTVR